MTDRLAVMLLVKKVRLDPTSASFFCEGPSLGGSDTTVVLQRVMATMYMLLTLEAHAFEQTLQELHREGQNNGSSAAGREPT